jgi:hypothetical protein
MKHKPWAVDSMPIGTFVEVTTDVTKDEWRYVERGRYAGHDGDRDAIILEADTIAFGVRRVVLQKDWILEWRVIR